jgi:hypothetical protein
MKGNSDMETNPGTERMRRSRERRRNGAVITGPVPLNRKALDALVAAGFLEESRRTDKAAVAAAAAAALAALPNRRSESPRPEEPTETEPVAAPPPRSKADAMHDFLQALGGGVLPDDLVEAAEAGDLDAARADIVRIKTASPRPGLFYGGDDWESRRQFEYCRDRMKEFGIPHLRRAIAKRHEAEVEVAWRQRIDSGFAVELAVTGAVIDKLIARGVFPAEADREDPRSVGAALLALLKLPADCLKTPPAKAKTPARAEPKVRTIKATSARDLRAAADALQREEAAAAAAKAE